MSDKITSSIIKTAVLHNLILIKGMIAATEISYMMYIADVLAYPKKDKNKLVEIEIKTDVNDLKNDFVNKQIKHDILLNPQSDKIKSLEVPNYFYFAIPFELIESCQELLIKYNKLKYGIMVYSDKVIRKENDKWVLTERNIDDIKERIFIIKPARKLFEPTYYKIEIEQIQYRILLRLMYEQCNFYKQKYFHIGGWDSPETVQTLKKEIKQLREHKDEDVKELTFTYWNNLDYDLKIEIDKVMSTKWSSYVKFNKLMSLLNRQKEREVE